MGRKSRKNTGEEFGKVSFWVRPALSVSFIALYGCLALGWGWVFVTWNDSLFANGLFAVSFFLFLPALSKLSVQLLLSPWYRLFLFFSERRLQYRKLAPFRPFVSVIVPAWNEEVGVLLTVRSLLSSTYRRFEIIVVNDGSTDGTDAVIRSFLDSYTASEHDIPVRYHAKENGGKGSALNEGLRMACGDIVITIDADSAVSPDMIEHIVRPFRDPSVMSVSGNVRIGNRRTLLGIFQQMEYLYGFFFKQADSILDSIYIVGGAAAAYRRSVFQMVGGFDEHNITEDIELSTRIQAAGFRVRYAPNALVFTEGPSDILGLCRQRLRWKYGRFLTFWKYRKLFFSLRKHHSVFLTCVSLPVALLSDIMLSFQWIFFVFAVARMTEIGDASMFFFYAAAISSIVLLQILIDVRFRDNRNLLWFVPVSSLMFLSMDIVELQALFRSLFRFVRGKRVVWQRWTRQGVFDTETLSSEPSV